MNLYGVLIATILLFFSGCNKKDSTKATLVPKEVKRDKIKRYTIEDIDLRDTKVALYKDKIIFRKIRQSIVIVYIFSNRCSPCLEMLPYIGDLQTKNQKELFVIGLMVKSNTNPIDVRKMMYRYKAPFFISIHKDNEKLANALVKRVGLNRNYPIPLTIIYKNGKYVIHIVGATPYEMLQAIVEQLKDKSKKDR